MSVALKVQGVSKEYRIYNRPGDRLKESLTRGRLVRHRPFWALQNISFEIETGATTGIIGPNGCGKSTLLQIVAGILEPTEGFVSREGRLAALLELGAGFNSEFTGVENVFMNAALMGFSKKQTQELLPAIERFAEIGPFLYQPVKTYSSGMLVRLAFAIGASVEPDIFLIDEALAVGDAVFQHRCLRRLKEMQQRGTTILFVSHDAAAIRALCTRAILLNGGALVADGKPPGVLNVYQKLIMEREAAYASEVPSTSDAKDETDDDEPGPIRYSYRHGDFSAEIIRIDLLDHATLKTVSVVETGLPVNVRMRARFHRGSDNPVFGFLIRNRHGIHVYGTNTGEQGIVLERVNTGEIVEVVFAFECWLGIDDYSIAAAVHSREGISYDWLDGVLFFRVTSRILIEGVANLNATATARVIPMQRLAPDCATGAEDTVKYG